jgi:hypothetical protein
MANLHRYTGFSRPEYQFYLYLPKEALSLVKTLVFPAESKVLPKESLNVPLFDTFCICGKLKLL